MGDSTESKLRKMEEEMSRFEAEIASQSQKPPGLNSSHVSNHFGYSQMVTQIPGSQYGNPGLMGTTPLLSVSSAPGIYMPPTYAPPNTFLAPPSVLRNKVVSADRPPSPLKRTIISAAPQMAGPDELAARAKEAAAAAEAAAKLQAEEEDDDDDDVTRALLAAAAGVTYSRTTGPNGKEKVQANVVKLVPTAATRIVLNTPTATLKTILAPAIVVVTKPLEMTSAPAAPPPIYSMHLDTSIPPPPMPITMRSTKTSTEEPYAFQKKKYKRVAAGMVWEDPTLADWDPNDFRIFCGDLGNEVNDDTLTRAFSRYPSFTKAKVVVDKRTSKSRGYGFVSFSDPNDFTRAMREMNGKYVGNRPIKLKKSDWKNRQLEIYRKREKEKKKLGVKI